MTTGDAQLIPIINYAGEPVAWVRRVCWLFQAPVSVRGWLVLLRHQPVMQRHTARGWSAENKSRLVKQLILLIIFLRGPHSDVVSE